MAMFPSQGALDLMNYMQEKGLNFQEMAELVEIGPDFLAHLVRGRKQPSIHTARRFEEVTEQAVMASTWAIEVPTGAVTKKIEETKDAVKSRSRKRHAS